MNIFDHVVDMSKKYDDQRDILESMDEMAYRYLTTKMRDFIDKMTIEGKSVYSIADAIAVEFKMDTPSAERIVSDYFNPAKRKRNESVNEEVIEHRYSNIQVPAPHDVAEKVVQFGLSIPDEDIYMDPEDPAMGRELIPHITIKWGLVTEDANEVESMIEDDAQTFGVVLGKVSLFEGDDKPFDVVKIDIESETLHRLHELFSKLENGDENPEYVPHMTIAYVKKGSGAKYVGNTEFVGIEFGVDCIEFKDQHGNSKQIVLNSNTLEEK